MAHKTVLVQTIFSRRGFSDVINYSVVCAQPEDLEAAVQKYITHETKKLIIAMGNNGHMRAKIWLPTKKEYYVTHSVTVEVEIAPEETDV